ncbi:TraB/VirB10 family protein [Vibrio pomeroyi]|uniref:TraB/VirB10 family protein n=1 Tax=Vibrio pomeroyi TaxID=198832 RepID=A0ABV4MR83_9VIBR
MDMNSLKGRANEHWQNPKIRYGSIAAILLGVVSFIAFNTDDMNTGGSVPDGSGQVVVAEKKRKVEANFFTQDGADDIDQGRMDEIYGLMEDQLAEREKAIDDREEEMRMMEGRLMQELETLRFTQNDLRRELDVQKTAQDTAVNQSIPSKLVNAFTPPAQQQQQQQQQLTQTPMSQAVQQVMPRVIDQKRVGIRTIDGSGDRFLDAQGVMTNLRGTEEEEVAPPAADQPYNSEKEEEGQELFLPAGSIVSGVLVTGMDVPTGNSVMRDPFPSLLRIKQEALLPNNFTADIRECVIVASAVGDMASRRAYLRAEAISCVTNEGKAVEANLNAFAVGPDGRNGIPGRLVSKNGEAAMKSAWAGFLGGMANLAGTSTFNIGDNETGVFGALQNPEVMQSLAGTAALQGAGDAMSRLADYYIEIAEQMKPYIEVNPGIEIDFIIQRGSSLRLN